MTLNNLIKVVSVSAGISGSALLGVWFWHQSPNPAQHAKSSTLASAPASESQLEASSGSVVSRTEVFAMEFSTRVAASNGQLLTSFQLNGPFTMTGFHSGKHTLVKARFDGALKLDTGSNAATATEPIEAAAKLPFLLEFEADGTFVRASGNKQTPAFIGRIWTALGEYLQLTGLGGVTRWEAHERDASGSYLASYEKTGLRQYTKQKVRYDKLNSDKLSRYEVVNSEAKFELDSEGSLLSFDSSEGVRASLESGPISAFEGATKLKLTRTSSVASNTGSPSVEADGAFPFTELAHDQTRADMDRSMIGKMTLADALTGIRAFEQAGGDKAEVQRAGLAFSALTAHLRRDPQALAAVRARLLKGGPLTTALLAALRDSSTPEGQKLLAELASAKSPLGDEDRLEAARSLSRVPEPTADTVHALQALRADSTVGAQATLGLGSALHRLKETDNALATEVRTSLTRQLADASSPSAQASVLTSLGNAGDGQTLDLIRGYISSPDASVRAAAAQALRRLAGGDADALLVQLCADPVPSVRYSAADAIAERTSSAILGSAMSSLALKETELQVRAKAVNVIAQWYPTEPAFAVTLQAVAKNDTNADLRNIAKVALGAS